MLSLGVLCSGSLGFEVVKRVFENHNIKFILTDSNSTDIISFAKRQEIPFYAGNPRKGRGYEFVKEIQVDVIASINYLFLIEKDIISHPKKLIFNIHGSLLPKYRGRTPHVWAIINGEEKAGITAHVVDEGCDTGKIIEQILIPIEKEDTGAIMLDKYKSLYFPLIAKVLKEVETGNISFVEQNHEEATYFGKRVPADGIIDWDLPKEKIRNWIRAQAYPYPGAFTFYEGRKITIDKVSIVDFPTNTDYKNGEIISVDDKVIVKTENGALKLMSFREEKITFSVGKRFHNENRK